MNTHLCTTMHMSFPKLRESPYQKKATWEATLFYHPPHFCPFAAVATEQSHGSKGFRGGGGAAALQQMKGKLGEGGVSKDVGSQCFPREGGSTRSASGVARDCPPPPPSAATRPPTHGTNPTRKKQHGKGRTHLMFEMHYFCKNG